MMGLKVMMLDIKSFFDVRFPVEKNQSLSQKLGFFDKMVPDNIK